MPFNWQFDRRFNRQFQAFVLFGSGCLVGALTLLPFAAQADAPTALPFPAAIEQLNLTDDQSAQLAALRQNTRSQLEAVVSPEQRQRFQTTWQQEDIRSAIAAMNLTPDQRQQVRSILQTSRQQAAQVLTAEQKQELRQLIRAHLDQML